MLIPTGTAGGYPGAPTAGSEGYQPLAVFHEARRDDAAVFPVSANIDQTTIFIAGWQAGKTDGALQRRRMTAARRHALTASRQLHAQVTAQHPGFFEYQTDETGATLLASSEQRRAPDEIAIGRL